MNGYEEMSDEGLMLAYRAGDAGAFDVLYGRYRGPLHRYLAHQCGNEAHAEELFQEIWLKVIRVRRDYEPLARFSTWIYRIAHHRLIDHYRKHAPEIASRFDLPPPADDGEMDDFIERQPGAAHETPHARCERSALLLRLKRALAELPAPQREVFLLVEEGELTLEEIGSATATSRETVKSRLRYALNKLRNALQDIL